MRGLDDQISGGWSDWDDDPWGCGDPDPDDAAEPVTPEPEPSSADPVDPDPGDGGSDAGTWGTMDPGWGYGAPATLDMLADADPSHAERGGRDVDDAGTGAETAEADALAIRGADRIDAGGDSAADDAIMVGDDVAADHDDAIPADDDAVAVGTVSEGTDRMPGCGDVRHGVDGDAEAAGGVDAVDVVPVAADDEPTIVLDALEPLSAPSLGEAEPAPPAACDPPSPKDAPAGGSGSRIHVPHDREPFDGDGDDAVDGVPAGRVPAVGRFVKRIVAVAGAVAVCLLIVGVARSCAQRSALRTAGESCSQAVASAGDALKGLRTLVEEASTVDDGDALADLVDDAGSLLDADAPACPAGDQAGLEKAADRASRIEADVERVSGRLREAIDKATAELLADASELAKPP